MLTLEPSEELPFQRPFPPEKIVKQSIIVKNEHPSLAVKQHKTGGDKRLGCRNWLAGLFAGWLVGLNPQTISLIHPFVF
jgi:hypothetical protein